MNVPGAFFRLTFLAPAQEKECYQSYHGESCKCAGNPAGDGSWM